jgi:TolB protein
VEFLLQQCGISTPIRQVGFAQSVHSIDRPAGVGAGSFFRCNQKRLYRAMDRRRCIETVKKICRRQIVMRGAAAAAGALTILLPKLATAYTNGDAARSAEPLVIAVPAILPGTPDEAEIARDMTQVLIADLRQGGRLRLIDPAVVASKIAGVDIVPNFADWRALGVRALLTGRVGREQQRLRSEFRVWDVESGQQLLGQLYFAAPDEWRKVGHAVSGVIFESLTGQPGHFQD